jgi:hypothetical protein
MKKLGEGDRTIFGRREWLFFDGKKRRECAEFAVGLIAGAVVAS